MSTSVTTRSTPAANVAAKYSHVRQTTVDLCSDLTAEDQMVQSMPDASPTKWHLAHTAWFFETFLLKPYLAGYRLFHDNFTYLFNSYYKQVGSHPNRSFRGLFSRPSLNEVHAYRDYVDRHMARLIETAGDDVLKLIVLGLNHEQQHQELIVTDIKHALWSNPLKPAWKHNPPFPETTVPALSWHDFKEGLYSIGYEQGAPFKPSFGLSGQVDDFCFDNESPRHQVFLNRFSLASRLITNGEYLDFMRDGGYSRPELWLSDGWDRINTEHWTAPFYWEERDGQWHVFTVNGVQPVVMSEPVCHVSYYEADAFARWLGARLPLESEWEVAARSIVETGARSFVEDIGPVTGNFLESGQLHPGPIGTDHRLTSSSDSQVTRYSDNQLFGSVWQWTSSSYTPYPGFSPATGALGEYNGKFMCNQMVLRGGSCATPQSHIRATYRNFFPTHVRWQFMGIRLAR